MTQMLHDKKDSSGLATALDYCRNLPVRPDRSIPRDHLIEEIKRALDGASTAVLIVGEALTGKSEVLADLYRREPDDSIGIFLGADTFFRSKEYVRLVVAEQISWIVDRKPLVEDAVSEDLYRRLLYRLQKHSRRNKITWLVDGLSSAQSSDSHGIRDLLALLPLGAREFNFVLSAESDIADQMKACHRPPKVMDMMLVSPDEARNYLSDLLSDDKDIQEVRTLCRSSVGRISMVRSFLLDGSSLETLLDRRNGSLESLFELEWGKIPSTPEVHGTIAIVLFSDRPITVGEIALQLQLEEGIVQSQIAASRILSTAATTQGAVVSMSSRAHRRFAATKLASLEEGVRRASIERLLSAADAKETVRYLPAQLVKAGRHAELLERLDPKHFLRLLEIEQTLRSLRRHADFGREAARQLGQLHTEVAFSLMSSLVTGLTLAVGRVQQIEALTGLGLHEIALEIAATAPTAEEKLHQLARAANGLDAKDYPISEGIRAQLKQLAEEVGGEALGELGIDIACDLLSVDVKLAESFLRRVVDGSVRLVSEGASLEAAPHGLHGTDASQKDTSKSAKRDSLEIPPHKQSQFWRQSRRRFRRIKAEQLLRSLKDEPPAFAMSLCTMWLHGNKGSKDCAKVADAALDSMLADTSRTPRIQDLVEIGRILPSLNDASESENLCGRLETQYRVLGHHGTSVDSVRLRMQLHRARYASRPQTTELDLIDLFVEVQSLGELSTRATCWAWMLVHLSAFKNVEQLESTTELPTLTSRELQRTMEELLASAADHFKVSNDALHALNRFNPELALEFISQLNTVRSRDAAYEAFVRDLVPRHSKNGKLIVRALSLIEEDLKRHRTTVNALSAIRWLKEEEGSEDPIDPELLEIWRNIDVDLFRFHAAVITMAYQVEAGRHDRAFELRRAADAIWSAIPDGSAKVELGYMAARVLANADRVTATQWIEKTESLVSTARVGSEAAINALYYSVRLATRMLPMTVVVQGKEQSYEAIRRLEMLISSIPVPELQVSIWTGLAIRLHFAGHLPLAKDVVDRQLAPILNRDYENNKSLQDLLVSEAAPALYLVHQSSAVFRVDSMRSEFAKDEARRNVFVTLLKKCPHWEPYPIDREIEYSLDQNTVSDLLAIIRQIKTDSTFFGMLGDLCRSLAADQNRTRLQRNMVLESLRALEETVSATLPDSRNIKHDGYVVVSSALIQFARSKVQRDSASAVTKNWESLYSRARAVPNVADRAVVTAIVGVNAHVVPQSAVKSWLQDVRKDLSEIPAAHDKLDRFEWIAKIVQQRDKVAARTLISDAIKLSSYQRPEDDVVKQQQRLLDFAHVIDPRLANDLVETFDADEARKVSLRKQLETSTKRKALASKPDALEVAELDDEQLVEICRGNLGSLMAGRINARPMEEFRELSGRARTMTIEESMPIWEWIVENSVRIQNPGARGADVSSIKLFEATCRIAEIAQGLVGQLAGRLPDTLSKDAGSTIFRAGDRDAFIARVAEWAAGHDGQTIWISDPYFAPSDLEFLRVLHQAAPNAQFRILTSKGHMKNSKIEAPEDSFLDAWQDRFDIEPPTTQIGVVGFGTGGTHPIHDRWVVSTSSGLRLGSSINSIGLTRVSEVSELAPVDAADRVTEIDSYFNSPARLHAGERLSVSYFNLH
ncbi:hypothetical protein LJR290_006144 [Variovorax sp. LjRoot290]|uniref:hypothetical protein n=1 Tax=Variovorax sp. LjRoot290 TaxID=3342316 RepID=UPI003ED02981